MIIRESDIKPIVEDDVKIQALIRSHITDPGEYELQIDMDPSSYEAKRLLSNLYKLQFNWQSISFNVQVGVKFIQQAVTEETVKKRTRKD